MDLHWLRHYIRAHHKTGSLNEWRGCVRGGRYGAHERRRRRGRGGRRGGVRRSSWLKVRLIGVAQECSVGNFGTMTVPRTRRTLYSDAITDLFRSTHARVPASALRAPRPTLFVLSRGCHPRRQRRRVYQRGRPRRPLTHRTQLAVSVLNGSGIGSSPTQPGARPPPVPGHCTRTGPKLTLRKFASHPGDNKSRSAPREAWPTNESTRRESTKIQPSRHGSLTSS
ncbi:hypothetical protein L227DRAFT_218827 [Lentinus tigrinus ALCF2SS1-6]|uniref:Uncharacterized protein n=1 Tax=Lentinus tigrinus ALCF2SS1-6 TaxID=1328759 RepID=A0A5C2SRC7_9APHY|nr:hypothetical protein L227DRAFT_218827 [Lentinus tigrinus ALCF2SS1-6]